MNGGAGARDANGFIARVQAGSGAVDALHFATGTTDAPLHAPRGMVLVADTLWVVDVDGVHGFDRRTGEHLTFVDLSFLEPGFLNDVARGPDGALYVTDTGRFAVYRIEGRVASVAIEGRRLAGPNGIAYDPSRGVLVTVPWEPGGQVRAWDARGSSTPLGPRSTPGRLDGVEPFDDGFLVASQSDSALYLLGVGALRRLVRVAGAPADIGLDPERRRVAVPYVDLDRVDVWVLPPT
jgi:sugar lactone lactonase YvrE